MASPNDQISDLHRAEIAKNLINWKAVSPYLGLTDAEQKAIEKEDNDYDEQKRATLRKWKEKKGDDGTYRTLIEALTAAGNKGLADYVKGLVRDGDDGREQGSTKSKSRMTKDATLTFLQNLPTQKGQLNIIQKCASNYPQLGIFLLSDDDGKNVKRIEMANHFQPVAIMTAIFQEWIGLEDHSWRVLIDCLRMCQQNSLAKEIEDALKHNGVSI